MIPTSPFQSEFFDDHIKTVTATTNTSLSNHRIIEWLWLERNLRSSSSNIYFAKLWMDSSSERITTILEEIKASNHFVLFAIRQPDRDKTKSAPNLQ